MHSLTEINKRVQDRYDTLMREGRHGHYETLFRVVHEERANAVRGEFSALDAARLALARIANGDPDPQRLATVGLKDIEAMTGGGS